jgi:glutamate racemase
MIGIFDSGLGGLTVLKEIKKQLPNFPLIYFGDTARLPYGTKSAKMIKEFSHENTKFLLKKGAKTIVIACNSSSAVAADFLKKNFNVPFLEVISPAVKLAIKKTKNNKIGVIATATTIKSGVYKKQLTQLSKKVKVYEKACPLFVPLIEEGWMGTQVMKQVIYKYLESLKNKGIDVLILGCTHYPLIKKFIKKEMGPSVYIVDSAQSIANILQKMVKEQCLRDVKQRKLQIFLSDEGYNFKKLSKTILGKGHSYKIAK